MRAVTLELEELLLKGFDDRAALRVTRALSIFGIGSGFSQDSKATNTFKLPGKLSMALAD